MVVKVKIKLTLSPKNCPRGFWNLSKPNWDENKVSCCEEQMINKKRNCYNHLLQMKEQVILMLKASELWVFKWPPAKSECITRPFCSGDHTQIKTCVALPKNTRPCQHSPIKASRRLSNRFNPAKQIKP